MRFFKGRVLWSFTGLFINGSSVKFQSFLTLAMLSLGHVSVVEEGRPQAFLSHLPRIL